MTPVANPRPRSHPRPAARLSGLALVAGSLTFALLPLAAFANTGAISRSENCQTWAAQVALDNNVDANHLVDVVVSPSFGHPGFTGQSFKTTGAGGPTTIWGPFTGSAPLTGTITLTIHNPDGTVENTQSATVAPQAGCHAPAITTRLSAGSVVVPGVVHDSATLTGASATAGGTVAYSVFTDTACSKGARDAGTKTVKNGIVPDSNNLTFDSASTVHWQAVYSGDAGNAGARSSCNEETLVVTAAPTGGTGGTSAGGPGGTTTGSTTTGAVQAAATAPGLPSAGHPAISAALPGTGNRAVDSVLAMALVLGGIMLAAVRRASARSVSIS